MSESVAILCDAMKGGSGDVPVPSCLNQCRNSEMFHCKICGEPFTNIHRLISHGADHRSAAVGARVRCAFCGQTFSSSLSLSLHQMVKDNSHDGVTPDLSCPLRCSQEMFSLDNLKTHLVTFHGCDKSTITTQKTRAGHVTVSADTGASDQCPRCGTNIVTDSGGVTMERHVMLDCSARSSHVARVVTRVTRNVSDFDPMLILRMEMEAVVTQTQNNLSDNDRKYLFLPQDFSEKHLMVKSNNLSMDADTLELFDVWSDYIDRSAGDEDILDLINKYEDDLIAQTKLARAVMISRADDTRYAPDAALIARLESELESGLSPCPRDIEMKITQLGLTL